MVTKATKAHCTLLDYSAWKESETVTPGNSLMKYADDTYLVIPAYNVDSRDKEIANIDAWAKVNNLTLNASKSVEIVFQDSRKRHRAAPPPVMHGIERVHLLKILGITFTDKLSVKEHLDDVISSSARSVYAIYVYVSAVMVNFMFGCVCQPKINEYDDDDETTDRRKPVA